jgi:hypothetical protein
VLAIEHEIVISKLDLVYVIGGTKKLDLVQDILWIPESVPMLRLSRSGTEQAPMRTSP